MRYNMQCLYADGNDLVEDKLMMLKNEQIITGTKPLSRQEGMESLALGQHVSVHTLDRREGRVYGCRGRQAGSLWWRQYKLILVKIDSDFLSETISQCTVSPEVLEAEINKGPDQ